MASRLWWIAVAGLLAASVVQRSASLFFLDAMLALAGLATYVWGRYALAAVTYTRQIGPLPDGSGPPGRPAAAHGLARLACGEETDLWVEIVNAKPLPLAWLKIEDEFPDEVSIRAGGTLQRAGASGRWLLTNLLSVRWYERVRRHYRIRADRRGLVHFGPAALTSGDVFGIRTRTREAAARQRLIIHPRVVPLADLGLAQARPFGDRRARRLIQPDPLQLAGVRPYAPGDSPRYIHWKATASQPDGTLQAKIFDPGVAPCLALLLNAQTLEFLYEGIVPEYFERAIIAGASVASAAMQARIPVGLYTNGLVRESEGPVRLPASRHPAHLTRLLDTLAQLTHFYNVPFHDLLRAEAARLPAGATVLAISPFVSEPILAGLLALRSGGHPAAILLVGDGPPGHWTAEIPVYQARVEGEEWEVRREA